MKEKKKEPVRFCDLLCPEAEFPKEEAVDGSGSCRTFVALYCKKHQRLNEKNGPCIDNFSKKDEEGA